MLTQAESQTLGVLLPFALMASYELFAVKRGSIPQQYLDYEKARVERERQESDEPNQEENAEADQENRHGVKVIGIGILSTGVLIAFLGAFAGTGTILVSSVGVVVGLTGLGIMRSSAKIKIQP